MRNLKLSVIVALTCLLATSCQTLKKSQPTTPVAQPIQNIGDDIDKINRILYGQWNVVNVNNQGVVGEDRPYIVFDTVATNPFLAKIYAYNGCNVINGTVAINPSGTMKKASDFLSTMKYCPSATYEIGISMTLENLSRFKIEKIGKDYILYLNGADGKQSLILRRSDLGFINGAWSVVRIGDKVFDSNSELEMVIDIPEMKVHGNAGCNVFNGDLYINPDLQHSLQFENVMTTRMTCPQIDIELSFLEALNNVRTVEEDHSSDAAVLRDSSGKIIIELHRLDLKNRQSN